MMHRMETLVSGHVEINKGLIPSGYNNTVVFKIFDAKDPPS